MKVQSCQNQGKRREKKTVDLAKIMMSRVSAQICKVFRYAVIQVSYAKIK